MNSNKKSINNRSDYIRKILDKNTKNLEIVYFLYDQLSWNHEEIISLLRTKNLFTALINKKLITQKFPSLIELYERFHLAVIRADFLAGINIDDIFQKGVHNLRIEISNSRQYKVQEYMLNNTHLQLQLEKTPSDLQISTIHKNRNNNFHENITTEANLSIIQPKNNSEPKFLISNNHTLPEYINSEELQRYNVIEITNIFPSRLKALKYFSSRLWSLGKHYLNQKKSKI
ncbi:MAG: hypothetical protein QNJ31_06340 [Candidatus Caenarcaniphilales bacterium]|nr:hypothetical protein [Candidatus Caenarcaniphilales bacterium]